MVDGWHWVAATIVAVLLIVFVLLWYDSQRERPELTTRQATKRALLAAIVIPVGFVLSLFLPIWVGAGLAVVMLIVIAAMALVD